MDHETTADREARRIYQPERVLVGACPACGRLLVIHNDHEVWPWITCACGWEGDTFSVESGTRYDRQIGGAPRIDRRYY